MIQQSLQNALESHMSRLYTIEVNELSVNHFHAVFKKDGYRYHYVFIYDGKDFEFVVKDHLAHEQIRGIFGTALMDGMDSKVAQVSKEFNFMYEFCFGEKTNFNYHNMSDIALFTNLNTLTGIEYSGYWLENYSPKFSATFFIKFNLEKLQFRSTGKFLYQGEPFIGEGNWSDFKTEFLTIYGANRIDKDIKDLKFSDGLVLPMMNY